MLKNMITNKLMRKIIAVLLVLLLSSTNFIFVVEEAYALYEEGVYNSENAIQETNEEAKEDLKKEEDNTVKSRIDLASNKSILSALDGKNDVTLTMTLLTNNDEKDILYKNPKFKIQMPENVKIESVEAEITAANGFTNMDVKIVDNNIELVLDGEQTEFNIDSINAQIKIDMKVSVDSSVPSVTSYFQVTYENENDVDESNVIISRTEKTDSINIYTGYGILTNLEVSNYDGNGGIINTGTISGGNAEAQIKINEENSKNAVVTGNLINNSDESIKLKDVLLNIELNSYNGNTTVLKSENIDISELKNDKEENVILSGENFEFNEDFTIPEFLYYNEKIIISYVATYMYNNKEYKIETTINLKTEEKDIVGDVFISDDRTSKIEITKVLGDGNQIVKDEKVKEGSTIKYIVTVTNLTSNNMENVDVTMERENNNSKFYDYKYYGQGIQGETLYTKSELEEISKILNIGTIASKENQTAEFEIVVSNNTEIKELVNKLEISSNGKKIIFNTQEYIETSAVEIENTNLKINLQYSVPQTTEQLERGIPQIQAGSKEVPMLLEITNISTEAVENVNVEIELSKYSFISNVYLYGENEPEYSFENGIFKFTITSIEAGKQFIENIHIDFKNIETASQDINFEAKTTVNNITNISNQLELRVIDASIKVESTIESNIENGATVENSSDIEYTITLKNTGNNNSDISVYDNVPSTYEIKDFIVNGESKINELEENKVKFSKTLVTGETVTIKIILKVNSDITNITNEIIVTVIGQSTQNFEYNYIVTEKEPEQEDPMEPSGKIDEEKPGDEEIIDKPNDGESIDNDNNPTNPDEENKTKYSISGKVWFDLNKNGAIDSEEKLLNNVKVMLVNVDNQNSYVKDENGKNIECTTGDNGEYRFEDLPKGNYLVIFDYDTTVYELTKYKEINVDERINSDVKDYTKADGLICGITDNIELISNEENINMGLVLLPKFDLKIENYITKVIVQNIEGTTTTEFSNSKLAKIEIPSKVVSASTVLIEYTIKITNNGELAGNVQEIVDYLPENIKFNSELNKDWYIGTDGNIYNNSLANTTIEVGEEKEIKLVLTKSMTAGNVGTTKNTVEITKYSNSREFTDINDIDNTDYSEILISIKTGDIVMYISLIIISIIITVGGIFFIKKKIL